MGKQSVVYLCNGTLFSTKEEQIAHTCYDMNKPQKHYARQKKTTYLYDYIYSKWYLIEMKVDQWLPGVGS